MYMYHACGNMIYTIVSVEEVTEFQKFVQNELNTSEVELLSWKKTTNIP